jgi:hypothetical protein
VLADHEVSFSVTNNSYWPAAFDALRAAGLTMTFADRIVIDIAHHVDDFAGHGFLGTGAEIFFSVLVLLSESEGRNC